MLSFSVFKGFLLLNATSSAETLTTPADTFTTPSETFTTLESVPRGNLQRLGSANNELALNLFRILASESSSNVFFSPFSISMMFGMLFYGARGETAEELRSVLGYEKAELSNKLVSESFGHYFREVLKSGNASDEYALNSANAVLVNKSFDLLDAYRRDVQEHYQAKVRDVDFANEASIIEEEMNAWVEEKTNGKIKNFLKSLNPETDLMLLNVVYFNGLWKLPFRPHMTYQAVFYNNGKEERLVPMMFHRARHFIYDKVDDFQALELPYKGEDVSMLIFLPNQLDGIKSLEESLTPEKIVEVQQQLDSQVVDVFLPKFNLEYEIKLIKKLRQLGLYQTFTTGANLSGMTSETDVTVNEIIHKAVIEVNEQGTEAAAATKRGVRNSNARFRIDHPFLFAIVEKGSNSNMILFLGRVLSL